MRRCCPPSRELPPYRNDELAAFRYGRCTLRASSEEIGPGPALLVGAEDAVRITGNRHEASAAGH